MAFVMRAVRTHRKLASAAAFPPRGSVNAAPPRGYNARRTLASSAPSVAGEVSPGDLCAQVVGYARHEWRRGERATAAGVLEHGAELVARASEGREPTPDCHVAVSRIHLAWAAMQSVRQRPCTQARSSQVAIRLSVIQRRKGARVPTCVLLNPNAQAERGRSPTVRTAERLPAACVAKKTKMIVRRAVRCGGRGSPHSSSPPFPLLHTAHSTSHNLPITRRRAGCRRAGTRARDIATGVPRRRPGGCVCGGGQGGGPRSRRCQRRARRRRGTRRGISRRGGAWERWVESKSRTVPA
jgi:hypothetical protein